MHSSFSHCYWINHKFKNFSESDKEKCLSISLHNQTYFLSYVIISPFIRRCFFNKKSLHFYLGHNNNMFKK